MRSRASALGVPPLTEIGKVQAVILAGGLGTRLRPYTFLLPKPMLPVGAKPILEHIIDWLRERGVGEVVVSTGYLGRMVEEYFKDGSQLGVKIEYARANRPLGIAGQLKSAEGKIRGRFFCLYGDAMLNLDLKKLLEYHSRKKAVATMALLKYETTLKYGLIDLDGEGRVANWKEKPTITGYINIGCYVMERSFLKYIPRAKMYGMKEAFERAIKAGAQVYGLKMKGEFLDIGDRRAYKEANELYMKRMGKML